MNIYCIGVVFSVFHGSVMISSTANLAAGSVSQ